MPSARVTLAFACAVVLETAFAPVAEAACGDQPGDTAAVMAARTDIDATCVCASFANHGAYVRCASGVIAVRVATEQLREECKGTVKRCAAKSTCGRAGAVACCRTNTAGRLRCTVKSGPGRCRPPKGGSVCVGTVPSCCDACGGGDCVPTTTSSSTTTSTSSTSTSSTSTSIATPCGDTYAACNGTCPAGTYCAPDESFPPTACGCFPIGVTPCSSATYPTCGGSCSGTAVCAPVQVYTFATGTIRSCSCLDPASDCTGNFLGGMCPGLCPTDTACYGEPEPAGMGFCVGCLPVNFP